MGYQRLLSDKEAHCNLPNYIALNLLKCRLLRAYCYELDKDTMIEQMAFLLRSKIGEDFYDLISAFCTRKYADEKVIEQTERFIAKYNELEFVKFARTIAFNPKVEDSSLITTVCYLYAFVSELYGNGVIKGIDENDQVIRVSVFDKNMSNLDFALYITTFIGLTFKTSNNVVAFTNSLKAQIGKYYRSRGVDYSKEKLEKALPHFNDSTSASKVVFSDKELLAIFQNFLTGFIIDQLWNVCGDSTGADDLTRIKWDREMLGSSSMFDVIHSILVYYVTPDLFRKRKFFVRDKGVTIHFNKAFDDWDYVYAREFHHDDEHFLIVIAHSTVNDHEREMIIPINDFQSSIRYFMYEIDFTLLVIIMYWLGLDQEAIASTQFAADRDDLSAADNEEARKYAAKYLTDFFNEAATYFSEDNYVYEIPYSWNHREKTGRQNKVNANTVTISKQIAVGPYTRRLPAGQHASAEAKAIADKYCIELEDDHTMVDGFTRMQTTKLSVF